MFPYALSFPVPHNILLLIIYCYTYIDGKQIAGSEKSSGEQMKMVRRAAFDIGSGSTKMQCSDCHIHDDSVQLQNMLFGQERPVSFGLDFMRSYDGMLSEDIQHFGLQTLRDLKYEAEALGATDFTAIATEVFRKAKNGEEYLERVRAMGIPVRMLSQKTEAELGFHSVVAMTEMMFNTYTAPPAIGSPPTCATDADMDVAVSTRLQVEIDESEACVWDSGGASFQITTLDPTSSDGRKSIRSYMGAFGTSVSTALLVRDVQGRVLMPGISANPVTADQIASYMTLIKAQLGEVPSWLKDRPLVGAAAGANSMFKLCCDILTQLNGGTAGSGTAVSSFTLAEARRALAACLDKTDEQLLKYVDFEFSEGPTVIVPKLALLNAVMYHTGIQRVYIVRCVGSCAGLMRNNLYWSS